MYQRTNVLGSPNYWVLIDWHCWLYVIVHAYSWRWYGELSIRIEQRDSRAICLSPGNTAIHEESETIFPAEVLPRAIRALPSYDRDDGVSCIRWPEDKNSGWFNFRFREKKMKGFSLMTTHLQKIQWYIRNRSSRISHPCQDSNGFFEANIEVAFIIF